jgi:hypothetical protein
MLLGEVAVTRGLTPEELEDRTVPDLDAVEARERERLRSEVSRRLETLLVAGRTVSADDFGGLFARHATVGPMARRLVWETDDGSAQFRIAEDGSYASLDHDAVALPPSSRIRLAHPARGGSWVAAWATHFAELEVIQPFEQLGRQVHVPTKAQGRERAFEVEAKRPVPAKKLLGLLESRGWRRDDRAHPTAFHRDHGETRAVLAITPGFEVHDVASAKAQSLRPLRFTKTRSASDARDLALGEVDAVVFSEAVRDAMAASALA